MRENRDKGGIVYESPRENIWTLKAFGFNIDEKQLEFPMAKSHP